MAFPTSVATGKGGKVSINVGDGNYLSLQSMTLQSSYTYKGETYTNRVYLLGTGQTLINMRPAVDPDISIDGISSEVQITPGTANDTVDVSSFSIIVDGTTSTVSAQTAVSFTRTTVSTTAQWVAVHVDKSTRAVTCTEGTAITGTTTALLSAYGSTAGQRPLIATDQLLVGLLKVDDGAALVLSSEIFYTDQERSDTIAATILPNIGGVLLNTALVQLHTGPTGRVVKFTGYYLDDAMVEIGTAKEWSLTPSTTQVSETFFGGAASQTVVGGWSFTFSQLATDQHVKNAMLNRQAMMAVRLQYANGGYWQSVGSGAGTYRCSPGAFNTIDVSGSLADDPVFV
jgi:hypothetical protein